MRISREEIFGPVLSILKYDDAGGSVDEAVALANNTEFGLGGLVFGQDPEAALAVADRTDTGSVGINFFASNHAAPFGGRRRTQRPYRHPGGQEHNRGINPGHEWRRSSCRSIRLGSGW